MLRKKAKQAKVIHCWIEYEANISCCKLFLDSTLYDKMNSQLSADWMKIKERYSIN